MGYLPPICSTNTS